MKYDELLVRIYEPLAFVGLLSAHIFLIVYSIKV